MSTALIVLNIASLLESLRQSLADEGYVVFAFTDGAEGLLQVRRATFDIILLDSNLPDHEGVSYLATLRQSGIQTPIIILTDHDSLDGCVQALDSGADDCVMKTVATKELLARIRSLKRRSNQFQTSLEYENLRMDLLARNVKREGETIDLTRREFELLEYLLRHKDQVVTREMLARDVWKASTATWTNVIEVQVKSLRRKIERPEWKKILYTIRGQGYQLGGKQRDGLSAESSSVDS